MDQREHQLNLALEAMHFGFRAMVRKPDQRLAKQGYSRIHHRLLYFIGRNPDCSINHLLRILGVSKQYLNRPLKALVRDGYVGQLTDQRDRRIRRLHLTDAGSRLEQQLSGEQRRRFAEIFRQVGPQAEQHWREVMELLSQQDID